MAKAMGLIFLLLDSAKEVPFGILQYIECPHFVAIPFIFADSEKQQHVVVSFIMEITYIFHSSYFDCRGTF